MTFNIGINVLEVDGRVTPALQGAPTSQAGFIIRSKRGVADGRVIPITSWASFVEQFGAHMDGAYGAYAIQGFFENGGAIAYVTRVLATDATAATLEVPQKTPDSKRKLVVTAAYRGEPDKGSWGDGVSIEIASDTRGANMVVLSVYYLGKGVEVWEGL